MKTMRAAGAAALVIGLAAGAGGCGADKVTIKDASGTSATVSKDGDKVTVKDKDGNSYSAGGNDLPEHFPKDDVPVVSGEVAASMSGANTASNGKEGWIVQIKLKKASGDCFSDASGELTDAGFTKGNEFSAGDTKQAQFTDAKYQVNLTSSGTGGDTCLVGYIVAPADASPTPTDPTATPTS